jgi:hypothetical protein
MAPETCEPTRWFQPFLRFWLRCGGVRERMVAICTVSTLLEILVRPVLRLEDLENINWEFQPFLRFWGLRLWFLWVFKFFCCFLQVRRSAWNHALHSFHTALGKIETPFFGVSRKEKREKSGKERHSSPLGFVGPDCQQTCPVGHLSLPYVLDTSSLAEGVYRLSDGGSPRLCAGRRRGDAHCDLHGAYLGEPTPRKVEGEAEKPNASVPAQIRGDYLYKSLHEEEG